MATSTLQVKVNQLRQALRSLRANINVPVSFKDRMVEVRKVLSNDRTGIINTVLNFMIKSGTVPVKIEANNDTLNNYLSVWQDRDLNRGIGIDVPVGLRGLTEQFLRERWKSSFIGLEVRWEEKDLGTGGKWVVPSKMFLHDGASLRIDGEDSTINNRKYFSGQTPLVPNERKSYYIRKPYNSWYDKVPTPFLVGRGILHNAMLKNAIKQKQGDVIEAIVPYILEIKSGSDKLAEMGLLADEEQLKNFKQSFQEKVENWRENQNYGDLIASLRYDTQLNHLLPDLTKIFNEDITKAVDKDLLAGLGLIELEGFGSTRQEAILNPKVLVEEVRDAVEDWVSLLEQVMSDMLEKNRRNHPKFANNNVSVIPGTIKSFITDDMKSLIRSAYDRGLISKQSATESITDLNFEVEVERRLREEQRGMTETMMPPVIQNIEYQPNLDVIEDEEIPDDRKPNTPEADNFNNALLNHYQSTHHREDEEKIEDEYVQAPYDTIDELPESVKVLPIPAQVIWLKTFNSVWEDNEDLSQKEREEKSIRVAWNQVNEKYKKTKDGNWVKK